MYAVVCIHSFCNSAVVQLRDTRDEAKALLRSTYESEVACQSELQHDFEYSIADDSWYARIIEYKAHDTVDLIEYYVSPVYS